jgi:hypothetical protein
MCLGIRFPSGIANNFSYLFLKLLLDSYGFVHVGACLTRGWISSCHLLLDLASEVLLESESLMTHHILLPHI